MHDKVFRIVKHEALDELGDLVELSEGVFQASKSIVILLTATTALIIT